MKIELKKISTNLRFSEETNMFKAELYVDGIKTAYCHNDGRGGSTHIQAFDKDARLTILKCEEHFKSLPKLKYAEWGGEYEQSLEGYVDDIIQKHLEEKALKSDMARGVVYKTTKGDIKCYRWKGITIAKLLEREDGRKAISECIAYLKKDNCQILNTNIPTLLK